MASFTERFSEVNVIQSGGGSLFPANRVAAVYVTPWWDMSTYHRAWVHLKYGVLAAGSTVDMIVQEAQDNAGTGVAAIAGKAITQLTQAGGDANDDDIIEIRSEELTPGFDFIRVQLTVAAAAAFTSVTVAGSVPRYPPGPVAQINEIIG